ncbi:MAG: hypothetical protein AABX66_02295 [Nanoarchaeota archaeon]
MINVERYLKGKGVNVSRSAIPNMKQVFVEPDNFYSLIRKDVKPESLDFLYSKSIINETKFFRILLKEWFYACKVRGYIIIEMVSNGILDFDMLIKEVKATLGNKTRIVLKNKKETPSILVLKKTESALNKNDFIDNWTFGIITNGKRKDWLDLEINSIHALGIKNYEIIVCGTYFDRKEKNFRYIHFNKKDDKGWITRKKNIICENAKYENIVVMHDKYIFDSKWYEGIKKFGNYFEILSNIIVDESGKRAGDWITYGTKWANLSRIGLLEYQDWDRHINIDGGFYVFKKDVWRKVKWDESLFWNQGEDIKLSSEFHNAGFVMRFNNFSKCKTLLWRHGNGGIYVFNNKKLGRIYGRPFGYYKWFLKQMFKKYFWKGIAEDIYKKNIKE